MSMHILYASGKKGGSFAAFVAATLDALGAQVYSMSRQEGLVVADFVLLPSQRAFKLVGTKHKCK